MKKLQVFSKIRPFFITKIDTGDSVDVCTSAISPSSTQMDGKGHQQELQENLYDLMRPLILFGRVITVIPQGKPEATVENKLKCSKFSAFPSVIMALWLLFKITLQLRFALASHKEGVGFMAYILDSTFVVNTCFQFFIYVYFLCNNDKFYRIFNYWSQLADEGVISEDPILKYWAYFLFTGILVPLLSHILGVVYALNRAFALDAKWKTTPFSVLEAFFDVYMVSFHGLISYNPVLVVVHTILYVWGYLSATLVPVMIIFFSRSLSFQFKNLIESSCNSRLDEVHTVDMKHKGKAFWQNLVYKYRKLLNVLKTVNNFISPILFLWTVLCIYNLSILLFRSLSRVTLLHVPPYLYATGFAVEVTGFVTTIIFAAMVNKNALKMLMVLRNCPEEDSYDTEVCRLEHQIATGQNIGFSGLGCFVITKPFLLKIFNAIFTMEIVMLQSESEPLGNQNSTNST